ncbi:MAG: NAD(P)H-binding protein [Deltaproteobacteria bacterium]|nr:NAD(P)H-binding protein [Deltaproteobacteria bacterium]
MVTKKIFITGGTGNIGRALIRELLAYGHEVRVLQRKTDLESKEPGITSVAGDILKPESYTQALKGTDVVIHAAGLTHTNDIPEYFRINTAATFDLIKACESNSVKRFIFISTRAISEQGGGYSISKLKAEEHVRFSSLNWVILRLSEVYGSPGREGVNMIINTAQIFPFVPVIGDGSYTLCPVYKDDAVCAISSMVDRQELKHKIYLIGGPETFTYRKFVDEVLHIYGLKKFKLYIPLTILKILLQIAALLSKNSTFVMDQVPRLLSPKFSDISSAKKDFGYEPRRLSDVLSRNKKI